MPWFVVTPELLSGDLRALGPFDTQGGAEACPLPHDAVPDSRVVIEASDNDAATAKALPVFFERDVRG